MNNENIIGFPAPATAVSSYQQAEANPTAAVVDLAEVTRRSDIVVTVVSDDAAMKAIFAFWPPDPSGPHGSD